MQLFFYIPYFIGQSFWAYYSLGTLFMLLFGLPFQKIPHLLISNVSVHDWRCWIKPDWCFRTFRWLTLLVSRRLVRFLLRQLPTISLIWVLSLDWGVKILIIIGQQMLTAHNFLFFCHINWLLLAFSPFDYDRFGTHCLSAAKLIPLIIFFFLRLFFVRFLLFFHTNILNGIKSKTWLAAYFLLILLSVDELRSFSGLNVDLDVPMSLFWLSCIMTLMEVSWGIFSVQFTPILNQTSSSRRIRRLWLRFVKCVLSAIYLRLARAAPNLCNTKQLG